MIDDEALRRCELRKSAETMQTYDIIPGLLADCDRNTTPNLQSVTYLFIGAWHETTEATLCSRPQ